MVSPKEENNRFEEKTEEIGEKAEEMDVVNGSHL